MSNRQDAIKAYQTAIQLLTRLRKDRSEETLLEINQELWEMNAIDAKATLFSAITMLDLCRMHLVKDDERFDEWLRVQGLHLLDEEFKDGN